MERIIVTMSKAEVTNCGIYLQISLKSQVLQVCTVSAGLFKLKHGIKVSESMESPHKTPAMC